MSRDPSVMAEAPRRSTRLPTAPRSSLEDWVRSRSLRGLRFDLSPRTPTGMVGSRATTGAGAGAGAGAGGGAVLSVADAKNRVEDMVAHVRKGADRTLWRAAALNIRNRYEIVRSFVCFDRLPSKEEVLELPGWRMSMPISFGLFWNDIGVRDIRFQSTY